MLRMFNIAESCANRRAGGGKCYLRYAVRLERIWLVLQLERFARMAVGHLATPGTSLLTEEA